MIELSLIAPTFNREILLINALNSFVNQSLPPYLYEILVIDNNSNDGTKLAVDKFINKHQTHKIKYYFVKEQGLHHARNLGVLKSVGNIIVFGDDDITADYNWLKSIYEEFQSNTDTGVVGGKILPVWNLSTDEKEWIFDYGDKLTHPVFAYLDYGAERRILYNKSVFGCNFAVRKELALQIGGSPPDTYPDDLYYMSGTGENYIIDKIRELGYKVVYLPNAVVNHDIPANRLSLQYFIKRQKRWAVETVFDSFKKSEQFYYAIYIILKSILKTFLFSVKDVALLKKRDLLKFIILRTVRLTITIIQMIRVLINPKIMKNIKQTNYLK